MAKSHAECEHPATSYERHICRNGRKYHPECDHPQTFVGQNYCEHMRQFPECDHGPGQKALQACTWKRKSEARERARIEKAWRQIQEEQAAS